MPRAKVLLVLLKTNHPVATTTMSSAQPNKVSAATKLAKACFGVVGGTMFGSRQEFFTVPDGVTKIIRLAMTIVPARK